MPPDATTQPGRLPCSGPPRNCLSTAPPAVLLPNWDTLAVRTLLPDGEDLGVVAQKQAGIMIFHDVTVKQA
eukprot:1048792-Pelagomonas_calceolata.AAC.6